MDGSMFIGTWWALVPPLLAIVLAFITKEVYSSLFIGVAVGAMLYSGFNPWESFVNFFDIMKNSMKVPQPMEDGRERRSSRKRAPFWRRQVLVCLFL